MKIFAFVLLLGLLTVCAARPVVNDQRKCVDHENHPNTCTKCKTDDDCKPSGNYELKCHRDSWRCAPVQPLTGLNLKK
ncbi:unnamed protein product [Clavelina lepadiformis]|uniref:Uncharacterized protein n=1 Tax=Clavelina lepadiformis TaxID=159417 RepID=A0ABP0GBS7_CLALP